MSAESDRRARFDALEKQVGDLSREVARLSARVTRLSTEVSTTAEGSRGDRETVEHLVGEVDQVSALLSELARRGGPAEPELSPVPTWLEPEPPARPPADLGELCTWVGAVYLEFPDHGLTPCWQFHPAVVAELFWLAHAHWRAFYSTDGGVSAISYWHGRERPDAATRLRSYLKRCVGLGTGGHKQATPRPLEVPLATSAARIEDAWLTERAIPAATEDESQTANQLLDRTHRDSYR